MRAAGAGVADAAVACPSPHRRTHLAAGGEGHPRVPRAGDRRVRGETRCRRCRGRGAAAGRRRQGGRVKRSHRRTGSRPTAVKNSRGRERERGFSALLNCAGDMISSGARVRSRPAGGWSTRGGGPRGGRCRGETGQCSRCRASWRNRKAETREPRARPEGPGEASSQLSGGVRVELTWPLRVGSGHTSSPGVDPSRRQPDHRDASATRRATPPRAR